MMSQFQNPGGTRAEALSDMSPERYRYFPSLCRNRRSGTSRLARSDDAHGDNSIAKTVAVSHPTDNCVRLLT
jgi:hypothetical protein